MGNVDETVATFCTLETGRVNLVTQCQIAKHGTGFDKMHQPERKLRHAVQEPTPKLTPHKHNFFIRPVFGTLMAHIIWHAA